MYKFPSYCGIVIATSLRLWGQGSDPGESSRGFTWYERFDGSVNTLGTITRLDSTAGYNFNSHFSIEGGVPVYFVFPSASTTATTGTRSFQGIGNAYGRLGLALDNPVVNFESTLTVSAPTGDQTVGLSTGNVTVDWSNYFDHDIAKLTPFAEIGLANAVSDTAIFIRPYATYGTVLHWEAGARYKVAKTLSISGSVYGVEPWGKQTLVNRLSALFGPQRSTGSDLTQDHGFSGWAEIRPKAHLEFHAGYTHSTKYALDTFFFGTGVSLGKVLRHLGI